MLQQIGSHLSSKGLVTALIVLLTIIINDEKALDRLGKKRKSVNIPIIGYYLLTLYEVLLIIRRYYGIGLSGNNIMLQQIAFNLSSKWLAIALIILLTVIINNQKVLDRLGKKRNFVNIPIIGYYLFTLYEVVLIIRRH